ncbi:hypothetical protein [Desulfosediminicola sp.]|uniref:hypothetical protein n=1 Tax=Desulfosediminicola sp. TaxID=2886825 RepID=UPI003AF2EFB6
MKNIKTTIEDHIVTNTVSSDTTLPEISEYISMNSKAWANKYVIWILNDFNFDHINSDTIRSFIHITKEASKNRKGLKTAMVAKSDINFRMTRMLSMLAFEKYAFPIEAFRDPSTAKEWFGENNKNI